MKRPLTFISDLLTDRAPSVVQSLRKAFGSDLRTIPGTKDIWCRDFMPLPIPGHGFVQFRYDPDYLRRSPDLRTANGAELLQLPNCVRSHLNVDGGNIVRLGDTAILTEKVFRENPRHERRKLDARLRESLKLDRLIFIPIEPGDVCGHSDGVLAFIDDKTLLVNDYRRVARAYGKSLARLLRRQGFELVPFPYCPSDDVTNGIPSADGVYINFLQTKDKVLLPTYGRREDDEVLRTLERVMTDKVVVPIRCNRLAKEGGVLHCVTWNLEN